MTYGIITQFASEAGFLWFLRTKTVEEPHFSLQDLARLDERVEVHIDGLRVAGDAAWEICRDTLASDYAEEMFGAAVLAFESGDETRIQNVLDAIQEDRNKARVIISALGWISYDQAAAQIEHLLADPSAFRRYIGIAASAIHRLDPGQHLNKATNDVLPLLIARGLRAYGELGRSCELDAYRLRDFLADSDDEIRFSAAWSASLARVDKAIETLKSFVTPASKYKETALNMVVRNMAPADALVWQQELAQTPDTVRLAVQVAGASGNPAFVPWLIEQMNMPDLARVAGEAFTLITGIDNELDEMKSLRPVGFSAGPNDDPRDGNIALDVDENLPWPNAEMIAAWWSKSQGGFPSGVRHLLGKPVTVDHLCNVLNTGLQRQRSAAALELAIMQPGRPLFEVRAAGFRQLEEMTRI